MLLYLLIIASLSVRHYQLKFIQRNFFNGFILMPSKFKQEQMKNLIFY